MLGLIVLGSGCASGPGGAGGTGNGGTRAAAGLSAPSRLSFKKAKTDAARYEALIAWTDRLVEEFGPQVEQSYTVPIQRIAENLYVSREFEPVFGRPMREIPRQEFAELSQRVQQAVDGARDMRWSDWRESAIWRFRRINPYRFTMEHKIPTVTQEAQELRASAERWARDHADTRIGTPQEVRVVEYYRNLTDPRWVRPTSDAGTDQVPYLFPAYRAPITAVAQEVYPAMVERRLRLAVDQAVKRLGSSFTPEQAQSSVALVEQVAAWCGDDLPPAQRREQMDRLLQHVSGPAKQQFAEAQRQITAAPATVEGVIAADDALREARQRISPSARFTASDGQTLSGTAALDQLTGLAERKLAAARASLATQIQALSDPATAQRLGEALEQLRAEADLRKQVASRLGELRWQEQVERGYWSAREAELAVSPGRLKVPAAPVPPTAQEVTLAICREVAEAYEASRPSAYTLYTPERGFGQPATKVVFAKVRDLTVEATAGGFRCTFTPSATVSYPGSGPGGVIVGAAQTIDATQWRPVTYTFQLTPGGWRSTDLGREANLKNLLRRR